MSIDLFCYTSKPIEKARELVQSLTMMHTDLFQNKFSISEPRVAGEVQKDIALEYKISAKSIFLVHLNDKSFADLVLDVSDKVKKAFGEESILILHNNDQRI